MIMQLISRVRRNHALEHATIHVLSERGTRFGVQGNATWGGYYLNLYGDVDLAAVEEAARDALRRMQGGEAQLAIHPNCGTVLLTTAALTTLTSQGVFAVEQRRAGLAKLDSGSFLAILPTAVLATVFAIIISRPLGMYFQTFTTDGRPGPNMQIEAVRERHPSPLTHIFRVLLGRNKSPMKSFYISTTG